MMQAVYHRWIETNSIKMHIAEQGRGNLVILCHGFSECWYVWRHQIAAIAEAGFHVVAPDLQGADVIVNTSSTAGLFGVPGASALSASKHAVMGLTRAAALDYANQGIRINAVNPGPIATELMARSADQRGMTFDDIGAVVPIGRIGQATEVAQAVVFLCSDAASYITGQPLVIDGAFTVS
jgi:NAD(P)-dependent dehydrogenase (short-subunit alcohol dehydrogenase family)